MLALSALPSRSMACSCFGPSTFCETLNPPYGPPFGPEYWQPDHVVLGVKLATVEYGVDLQVIQDFRGVLEADEIIRVWGDCGFLCRMYNYGVTNGDTVLWGIQNCDLGGNFLCGGTDFEEESHYQIPVCGIYWLGYANGVVSAPLFTEGATETVGLEDFGALVQGCLPTRIDEPEAALADVWCDGTAITIETGSEWSDGKQACITDAGGRVLLDVVYRGTRSTLPIPSESSGILLVRVSDGHRSFTARLFAD
ncbi:MAG: hypothetical protein IPM46_08835 [Flavobacteriales bacterium]|nr:hypothetical protein [Flavobacteriales bacterium]